MSGQLTVQGLVIQTLQETKQELDTQYADAFGQQIKENGEVPSESALGQIIGISAERERDLCELLQALDSSLDVDNATGKALERLCAITGTIKEQATKTSGLVYLTGAPATVIASGSKCETTISKFLVDTTASVTLAAAIVWTAATARAAGDIVTSNGKVYLYLAAGTSGVAGMTGTQALIFDGTAQCTYLGEGTAAAAVLAQSAVTGPLRITARQLDTIKTPIVGWQSVINVEDMDTGQDQESDPDLRIRRYAELFGRGSGTFESVKKNVLEVGKGTANAVNDVVIFENVSDFTDVNGIPPHSFETLVLGGDNTAIAKAIYDIKDLGIRAHGSITIGVTGSDGVAHPISFSRPTDKDIWIEIDVLAVLGRWPIDGIAQAVDAILAYLVPANGYTFGKDVTAYGVGVPLATIPGLLKVSAVRLGLAAAPVSGADIPIAIRELARFDSSRIAITVSYGVP